MAKAELKTHDPIFSPIATQLRARASEYRAKGYESTAQDLEREAADADVMASIGSSEPPVLRRHHLEAPKAAPLKLRPCAGVGGAPCSREKTVIRSERCPDCTLAEQRRKARVTRQSVKPGAEPSGELPWWATAKLGEMTSTAEQQRERMQASPQAKKVTGLVDEE